MARYNTKAFSAIYNTVIRTLRGRLTDLPLLSAVKDWINDGQDEITNRAEWPWLETRTSGYLSGGIGSYNLLSASMNMLKPIDFVVWNPDEKLYRKLVIMKPQEADQWYPGLSAPNESDAQAMPVRVYIFGEKFYPQPVPDATYRWWMRYYNKPSRMTAASAVSKVPYTLLENYALWKGCNYQNDPRASKFMETFYALLSDYYEKLIAKDDDYLPCMAFMDGGKIQGTLGESDPWWV